MSVDKIRVGNAPCSWGVIEGFESDQPMPGYAQVLDEMALAGYAGTELGDWGFMPTDPHALRLELATRNLMMVGGFVPVALADPDSHAGGEAAALRTASLLAKCAERDARSGAPFIVLAGDNGTNATRRSFAGRIQPEHGLSEAQWRTFAEGAQRIAQAVRDKTGLRTVFHHHCAGFVETPAEIATLLRLTDPELIGLCLDTGHYAYGGGDALDGLKRHGERVWHVHFKDCDARVAAQARTEGWEYLKALRNRIFCELGRGEIDFVAVLQELVQRGYEGWIVVEDEVVPGTGTPLESAQHDRDFLRSIGL